MWHAYIVCFIVFSFTIHWNIICYCVFILLFFLLWKFMLICFVCVCTVCVQLVGWFVCVVYIAIATVLNSRLTSSLKGHSYLIYKYLICKTKVPDPVYILGSVSQLYNYECTWPLGFIIWLVVLTVHCFCLCCCIL